MEIKSNISLQPYNTFGIHVKASSFAEAFSVDDIRQTLDYLKTHPQPLLIIGGGSNVLFTQDFNGLVLKNALGGIAVIKVEHKHVLVKVAAGENWHEFVLWSIENNYAGIENLSLIPGCVGASPMQNIGAYGVEIKDVFVELEAIEIATGSIKTFTNSDCAFGYRESIFKNTLRNQYIITAVTFRLQNLNTFPAYHFHTDYGDIKAALHEMMMFEPTLKAVSDAVIKIRSSKLPDPKVLGNAGSFFKNPVIPLEQFNQLKYHYPLIPSYPAGDAAVKVPAGWLIEQCGWKGKQVGNTGAHAKQALVLVNYGNASGSEIIQHARAIMHSVKEKFGISIEPEVNIY